MVAKMMKDKRLFGTDGIRCIFGSFPLQPSILPAIGYGIGQWIKKNCGLKLVVMGRDTRASGLVVCDGLCQGLKQAGIEIWDAGVVPTPAVSFLARYHQCVGVMVSASHNPAAYNGMKFFNPLGEKLSDRQEASLALSLEKSVSDTGLYAEKCGPDRVLKSCDYEDFLCQEIGAIGNIRLAVDAANGSLHAIAVRVLERCGASVVSCYGMAPDGQNINHQCGALHPENLQKAVCDTGADLGLSFDGDGDRVIVVDRQGAVQDGDQILGFLSIQDHSGQGVVGTVMSNMALESLIYRVKGPGSFVRSRVGDRWIAQCLRKKKWSLGGEACGHILRTDVLPTGDGLLIGMMIAKAVAESRCTFPIFQSTPSLVKSLNLPNMHFFETSSVQDWIARYDDFLTQKGGRFVVRPSGTEPKLRLLIEAPDTSLVTETMGRVVADFLDLQSNSSS